MTEIFFSYSSRDRGRVQPLRDALIGYGFSVFWDQEVPTGTDWDTWIRRHLTESRCAIVVWSANSVGSDNVRHEATIAKQQNKLVPVLIESLVPDQFPMGLYAMQAANLSSWAGDLQHAEWLKLLSEIEFKLTPAWVKRIIDSLDAELLAERTRRESAERRDRVLRDQIAKEAQAQQELRWERDRTLDDAAALKAALDEAAREQTKQASKISELMRQIGDAGEQRQLLLQQLTDASLVIARLEEGVAELEKTRDEALGQAATVPERGRATEMRAVELTGSLRDAHATIATRQGRRETLDGPAPEPPFAQVSAVSLESSTGSATPLSPVPLPGIGREEVAVQRPFASRHDNGRAVIVRLRVGAVFIGTAFTLAMWAVAFQSHYPNDFLIKYNYLLALGALVTGLALLRGVSLISAIPLVVTWSILGSALTLIVSASLFRRYYPNDNLITGNYFLSLSEIGVWWLLAEHWEGVAEPPRGRVNDKLSRSPTRTGPDGAK